MKRKQYEHVAHNQSNPLGFKKEPKQTSRKIVLCSYCFLLFYWNVNNNVCLSLDEKKTIWTPCTPWIWDSSKVPLSQWLYSYLEGYELKNKQATVRLIDILSPLDLECHQAWLHLAWGSLPWSTWSYLYYLENKYIWIHMGI